MDNIIIFGGTFDPVHNGHIAMAEHAVATLNAKHCIWVPNKVPLLKNNTQATTQQRLDMLELAIQQSQFSKAFLLDKCEINRPTPSYTTDTLTYFRHFYGKKQSLSLLVGEDAFVKMNQWHDWENIIDLTHIIVVTRPSQACQWPKGIMAFFERYHSTDLSALTHSPCGKIHQLTMQQDVSSTDIRNFLHNKETLKQVCPNPVVDYIVQNQVYQLI